MFSQVSVILSAGEKVYTSWADTPPDRHPPRAETPLGRQPPWADPHPWADTPLGRHPPSRQYASYWNAFLLPPTNEVAGRLCFYTCL